MRIFPKRRMMLSLIGILVCAILFFGTLSVIYWIRFSSKSYFGEAADIYVLASSNSSTVKQSKVPLALAPALSKMPGIKVVCPELFIYSVLEDKAVIIRGIFPADFRKLEPLSVVDGRWLSDRDIKAAVAGYSLAKKLDLRVNDTYTISGSEVDDFIDIKIVGIFRGNGMIDDDLLLNMNYARYLQNETREGYCSIIRAKVNTTIWPTVESIWEAVSGPPKVSPLTYFPAAPNNTERIRLRCNATAQTQIGSVILLYKKAGTSRIGQKTMNLTSSSTFETEIGPVKDSPWVVCWAKATDALGHQSETKAVNISVTDALGPDIFDVDIQPPPPQTKDDEITLSFKVLDTSELVRNVTVHTFNAGQNKSIISPDSSGGPYHVSLGNFKPGRLLVWVSALDRFGNPARTPYYNYRIVNRTDQSPPDISEILHEPSPVHDNETVNLTVRITDDSNITQACLTYDYHIRGMHYNGTIDLNRSKQAKDFWTAVTGPFPGATTVHFRVYARDEFENAAYSRTNDIFIRYSEPPETVDITQFPFYSPPGVNNLLFITLYDAAEIDRVNVSFHDRGRWKNLSTPVGITTFKEPVLLGRLSPGHKGYSLAMTDRRGEITRTPPLGETTFYVGRDRPTIDDVRYDAEVQVGKPVKVSFLPGGYFPLSYVYVTDSRGVIDQCEWTGSDYFGVLGPYPQPGEYTFNITAEDSAGNIYHSPDFPLHVLEPRVKNVRFSPSPPLIGEQLTVTCEVLADSPMLQVALIAPVKGRYVATPMHLEGSLRTATIPIDAPGILPFSIQVKDGDKTFRSPVKRIAIGPGVSLFATHEPSFPTSKDPPKIHITARDSQSVEAVVLDWKNATASGREIWRPGLKEFSVDFFPENQLFGFFAYKVRVFGSGGDVLYPVRSKDWIEVFVTRNIFDPPRIIASQLSPTTYINTDGTPGSGFLVQAGCVLRDDEGISSATIEYVVGDRSVTEPLFPGSGYFSTVGNYLTYLGPYPVNQTIRFRIVATNIAGLTSSSSFSEYTLMDTRPPKIAALYHDPLEPTPDQEVTIGCEVKDDSGVKDVLLLYGPTGQEYSERMQRYGDTYTLQLVAPPAGRNLTYMVLATDNYGNSNRSSAQILRSKDENPPRIVDVTQVPLEPTDRQTVNITVTLYDLEDAVENVTLLWYQYEWKEKTQIGGKERPLVRTFHINASEFEPGIDVRYKIEAYDRSGNKAVYPSAKQAETQAPQPIVTMRRRASLGQEAWEPYLTFRVLDKTPPSLHMTAYPTSPNELQTVTFAFEAKDNHLLKNLTLQLYVGGVYMPYEKRVGRPSFEEEVSSGPLKSGEVLTCYLEGYDQSGNYARFPPSSNISIHVKRLEWGGQVAVMDPRVNLEVAAPAGFSEGMARQGAGKIITSINGILFMTFLATIAGIGNIIYTSVYRSKREIGILRTLGGSKKFVTLLVATLTALIGFLGGAVGCLAAYGVMAGLSSMGASLAWVTLKPTFNLLILIATLFASVTISLFGGMVALARLFSYTPVESLRIVTPPAAKVEQPTYLEKTRPFPVKTIAVLLLLMVSAGAVIRLYPTHISGEPFDPDSWLHLKAVSDMRDRHHIYLGYDSRELQAVSALPGLNILLLFSQELTGRGIAVARFLPALFSSLGLILAFVLARRLTNSATVGAVASLILAFAGFYSNRTAALTKEALALQLFLLSIFLLYTSHRLKSTKLKTTVVFVFAALMFTHHLTSIYFVLLFVGYLSVTNLVKYSRGNVDRTEVLQDVLTAFSVLMVFFVVSLTLGRFETRIPLQDAMLILSLFFLCLGVGRLLIVSSIMEKHRDLLTLAFVLSMILFPFLIHYAGLFEYAPWGQVLPSLGPHLVLLGLAVLAVFPISIMHEEQKALFLAWISTVLPFVFYGMITRDLFGYILFFRNVTYGYQLAAVMAGTVFVYAYRRLEAGGAARWRRLVIAVLAVALACDVGLASFTGFLFQDYEKKDLYHPREIAAARIVNQSTLRGRLVGADERARRLLLYFTGEDGDQVTTYVYLVRMEKYLINRLRRQVEMTNRSLTHVFTYEDMYRVGFIDTVLFKHIKRPSLNRFEDVIFDNGDEKLTYVARKEWP